MVKNSVTAIGCFVFLCVVAVTAHAGVRVNIVTSSKDGYDIASVDVTDYSSAMSSLSLVDPNFQKDGRTHFSGITLNRLLSLLKIQVEGGVTVVAKDQYIGYIPVQEIEKDTALLAWQMDQQLISPLKGGPLKIVYPNEADVHGSCYVWYVDTIFIGSPAIDFFHFTAEQKSRKVFAKDWTNHCKVMDHKLFSIPAGCKNSIEMKDFNNGIRAIELNILLSRLTKGPPRKITLVPFAGRKLMLNREILKYPVYITLSCGDKPIHYALGGPFSVIFPIEKYQELASFLPESGSIFFLKEIIVE